MTNTKAEGLRWLSQQTDLDFMVPKFLVLDASVHDDVIKHSDSARLETATEEEARRILSKGLERRSSVAQSEIKKASSLFRGKNVAVRSSALVGEDSTTHSGAGIYQSTFLDRSAMISHGILEKLVSKERRNLTRAVLDVYASLYTPKARSYVRGLDTTAQGMEVIIQEIAPTLVPFSYGRQRSLNTYYGTAQTRLHSNNNIVPVHYANRLGRVVGITLDGGPIEKRFFNRATQKMVFPGNLYLQDIEEVLQKRFLPLLEKIKERYCVDFETEFCIDLTRAYDGWDGFGEHPLHRHPERYDPVRNADIYLLQIRPLTNLRDSMILFPNKEPILIGEVHMGEGEYIGPWYGEENAWKDRQRVRTFGEKPTTDYAYLLRELSQVDEGAQEEGTSNIFEALYGDSRIKAVVATTLRDNGIHVQTIANEKGIMLVGRNNMPLDELLSKIKGRYIHVVSDGIRSAVYNATEEEYQKFVGK